jgi:hypothetical protein
MFNWLRPAAGTQTPSGRFESSLARLAELDRRSQVEAAELVRKELAHLPPDDTIPRNVAARHTLVTANRHAAMRDGVSSDRDSRYAGNVLLEAFYDVAAFEPKAFPRLKTLMVNWVHGVLPEALAADRRARFEQNHQSGAELDVLYLAENGAITVIGVGMDITRVIASTTNLTGKELHVVIAPGTCFTSEGAHQNMVSSQTTRLTLQPHATETVHLQAACVNAERPIPGGSDQFRGVHRVSESLTRFLQHTIDSPEMVRQAGVWAITDNYTGSDVKARLVTRDQFGNQQPAVNDGDIAEARRILDLVGVRHRL